jgi:hypothetical protein
LNVALLSDDTVTTRRWLIKALVIIGVLGFGLLSYDHWISPMGSLCSEKIDYEIEITPGHSGASVVRGFVRSDGGGNYRRIILDYIRPSLEEESNYVFFCIERTSGNNIIVE